MRPLALFWLACVASSLSLAQEPAAPAAPPAPPSAEESLDQPARDTRREPSRTLSVTWQAPEPLRALYIKFLPPPTLESGERRAGSIRPWLRDVRRRVPEIAASEGYFSATLDIQFEGERRDHVTITVTPGLRTVVEAVDIEFEGDLALDGAQREKRRRELRAGWALTPGQPFRSSDWDVAKTRLQEALVEVDYAAGDISSSRAEVDAEAAKAHLKLTLASGPPFTLGEVGIQGVERYPESIIRRVVDLKPGERYRAERLIEMQRRIQNGPWFSSVVVEIERDPAHAEQVPVKIVVSERPTREVGLALGYGTDDGARSEVAFRHRNLFNRGFDLQSSLRVSQQRQIGYADVYLPPGLFAAPRRGNIPFTDSFGVLTERSTLSNLNLTRFAVAGYRHFKLDTIETRVGLTYQIERSRPDGADERIKRAFAPIVAFTWRNVDNIFDPRRGGVLNVQFAAGSKTFASGDDFLKTYAQYQHWFPLGARDQVLLRTEIGRTFAVSRERIPEDFLFRAGGSRSNRGYAFQSLGVTEGDAIVGGRYLATATAEYVHWLNDTWGAAVFTDIGDAADSIREWQPLRSYGVGARYRTPAGPFALDLAYGERDRKFRLAFSVTVAF